MTMMLTVLSLASLVFNSVLALPQYAAKIPNGHSVPNPGPQGGIWAGVGHVNAGGRGERNPFGIDFAANGHEWTKDLCETDSDGDGRTNGEELGDPNCSWKEGEEPDGPAVSHPGIDDEPIEVLAVSDCDDYVTPDDEVTIDIVFTQPSQMDKSQTHYICEQKLIDVPSKTLLHKIKHGILLDNADVLHHMFVYICPAGTISAPDGDRVGEGQYDCDGNESGCLAIGGWAVGPLEHCNPSNVGTEVDFSGVDQVVFKIEAHYDNTKGEPQQDQSGIRLHFTPTLRPLSGNSMIVGKASIDVNFVIPPQQEKYPLSSLCPTAITEIMNRAVFAYEFSPHMHLYGRTLVTEHYRCGKKIGEIGRINSYEFDNQQTYALNPPIKILPGDALVTTCEFDTSTVTDVDILGGDETTNEMCLNFISTYPPAGTELAPNLMSVCMSFEDGAIIDGQTVPFRVAVGDRDTATVTQEFDSDPEENMGDCCANDNCEEIYLSDTDGACGVDEDCVDGLVCDGGLCKSPPVDEPSSEERLAASGAENSGVSFLIALLFPLVCGLL